MIPLKTIEDLISKHSLFEKELSTGDVDKKLFAEKSKEYSDLNDVIDDARKYFSYEGEKKDLEKILSDFNISLPILISLTGSSDNEILIVSPIPSIKRDPKPIEDLMLPEIKLPASVIPKCKV